MTSEDLEFQIIANDKASKIIDHVADDADKLEGKDVTVNVDADDKASRTIDDVNDEAKKLDGKDATVDVKATDHATEQLNEVLRRTKSLDKEDATVILKAEAGKANSEIRQLTKLLGQVDGDEATVVIKAKDEATARLKSINTELASISAAPAVGQFQALQTKVGEAEGFFGKLSTAGTGAFTAIQGASAATVAAVAGTGAAVVGAIKFVKDAFTDFQEVARNARDLGASSGLTSEEASRWIAVADDFGVSADSLNTSIGKVGKSIDQTKWEQYGIQTRDAGGKARDVNDILLDTFDVLSKMPNATERNTAGNKLLGKGYKDLAPLIGTTKDEMVDYLAAVEDGQVITEQEQKRAEDMRRAQDHLADAFGEVELAVGGVVAGFGGYIDKAANMVSAAGKLSNWVGKLFNRDDSDTFLVDPKKMDAFIKNGQEAGKTAKQIHDDAIELGAATEDVQDGMTRAGIALKDFGDISDDAADATAALKDQQEKEAKAAQDSADAAKASAEAHQAAADALTAQSDAMRASADATFGLNKAQSDFHQALDDLPQKLEDAKGDLYKVRDALDDVTQSAADVADAQVRVADETATASGKQISATDKLDIWNRSMLDAAATMSGPQRDALLHYIGDVNDIPDAVITDIAALLDTGSVAAADNSLTTASAARTATITAAAETTEAEKDLARVTNQTRTAEIALVLTPKGVAAINDQFAKWHVKPVGTSGLSASSAPMTVNVNLPRGARHTDIARAMNTATRRSGRRYGNPAVHHARR